jgi:hypothetical protein
VKIASVLLFLPIAFLQAALDLTPVAGVRVLDGIKFQQLSFSDNGHTVTYEQPRGWSYRVEAGRILFMPPNLSQAEAAIEQVQTEAGQAFDEETMKRLQEQAMRAVPASSQKVELVSADKNPVMVNRHETFEVIVSYQMSGTQFRRSVLFLNLPDTQLRFRIVAKEQDFEKVHRAFRGSLFSWQWQ